MSKAIPQKICQIVVEDYFTTPKSMDWIAEKCGIAKSSVSNIVHSKMADDPSFELMRYLVVNLRKNGTDVAEYATGIRIQHMLHEYGFDLETGDSMIEKILVMCYREHWDPSAAISTLKRYEDSAREWGLGPNEYASDRNKCYQVMKSQHDLIAKEQKKLQQFLSNNAILRINYSMLGGAKGIFRSRAAIEDAKVYKEKYYQLLRDTQLTRKDKSVDKKALHKLNRRLGWDAVTEQRVLEKLEDIRVEPEKYWFLFSDDVLLLKSDSRTEKTDLEASDQSEQN